jgi:hypothetical protein
LPFTRQQKISAGIIFRFGIFIGLWATYLLRFVGLGSIAPILTCQPQVRLDHHLGHGLRRTCSRSGVTLGSWDQESLTDHRAGPQAVRKAEQQAEWALHLAAEGKPQDPRSIDMC